jgi:hypothetical protein
MIAILPSSFNITCILRYAQSTEVLQYDSERRVQRSRAPQLPRVIWSGFRLCLNDKRFYVLQELYRSLSGQERPGTTPNNDVSTR